MDRKTTVRAAWTLAACIAALGWAAPAPGQVGGPQAVADLNTWRAELGLPAVTQLDAAMSAGCRRHNRFLALNPALAPTHDETPGLPGSSPGGQAAGATSVLAYAPVAAGPRELWELAVFHRTALLNPRLRTTWWALNDGWACMGTEGPAGFEWPLDGTWTEVPEAVDNGARAPAAVGYPSPADGATDVPTSFDGGELPDPRVFVPGRPSAIGWPLSVSFNGPWSSQPRVTLASGRLATVAGEAVDVTGIVDARSAAIVLPNAPLQPGTDYVARVAGVARTHPFDVTWRFRTAGEFLGEASPEIGVRTRLSRERLAVVLAVPFDTTGRTATISLWRPPSSRLATRRLVLTTTTRTTLKMPARGPVTLRVAVWGQKALSRVIRRSS